MKKALDFSFDAAKVTADWCKARLAEGYEVAIADLWTGAQAPAGAEQALRCWREAGGITAGYFCVHDSRPVSEHFAQARANAGAEWARLAFVAVDVEIAPVSAATVHAAADAVASAGLRSLVYTSWGEWELLLGKSTACSDLDLWDASQGVAPSLDMAHRYGGWTVRTGHQYSGNVTLDGIMVDQSIFADALFMPQGPTPGQEWANARDVLHGAAQEFATMAARLTELAKEIGDVGGIVERLQAAAH